MRDPAPQVKKRVEAPVFVRNAVLALRSEAKTFAEIMASFVLQST